MIHLLVQSAMHFQQTSRK